MARFEEDRDWWVKLEGVSHLVGRNHIGVQCEMCRSRQSGHKVEEDYSEALILFEENGAFHTLPRHPLTSYVCCSCFKKIMGPIVNCA